MVSVRIALKHSDKKIFMVYVRPKVEYVLLARPSHLKIHILLLEKFYWYITRMMPEFMEMSFG